MESLSFEKKNFVLGRRGQVSGWEGSDAWGQRRKRQRFNWQGKNALPWFRSSKLRLVAGITKLGLHLSPQSLAQKRCCRPSVLELERQIFELRVARASSTQSPQSRISSFYLLHQVTVSPHLHWRNLTGKKKGGNRDVQPQCFVC